MTTTTLVGLADSIDETALPGLNVSSRRTGRELVAAAREYAKEDRARSWFHFVETFGVFGLLLSITVMASSWWTRLPASIVLGLVTVRGFILYHDYMHNAILRDSRVAKVAFSIFGVYVLTPPNVWRQTHNYHHAHTAKIVGSHVGSYLLVSTDMWKQMTPAQQRMYKVYRHPLTIFFAYFTVFMYGMCLSSFLRNKRKNWDSLLAVVLNVVASIALVKLAGFAMFFYAFFLPLFVATMTGAYLFYAQHNFPDAHIQPRESWDFSRAALESSSFMELGPVWAWLTGNIGYHHVHHLNAAIPFYRLPEAMEGIPELQSPEGRTDLSPASIIACFEAKLWDAHAGRMVGYPD